MIPWTILTVILRFATARLEDEQTQFVKSDNLSPDNLNSATVENHEYVKSSIECSSLCSLALNKNPSTCNSYLHNKGSKTCSLAQVTFLEDYQPNVAFPEFYIEKEFRKTLHIDCQGSERCCNPNNVCSVHQGDCDLDEDCQGFGLICGSDNCLGIPGYDRTGGNWNSGTDCCERRCTPEHPCALGQGDCDTNNDCNDVNFLNCRENSCLDQTRFPVASFPDNVASKYSAEDDCCARNCYTFQKCGNNEPGCLIDDECENALICLPTGICGDVDECTETPDICGDHATCTNEIGSYNCECHSGYGNHVVNVGCSDIDECTVNPTICGTTGDPTCVNTDGSYNCQCPQGFNFVEGTGCVDIDECDNDQEIANCGTNTVCTNTPGSYSCACEKGYKNLDEGVGCVNINECTEYNYCATVSNAFCTDTDGEYYCKCNPGHVRANDGSAQCYASTDCGPGAACVIGWVDGKKPANSYSYYTRTYTSFDTASCQAYCVSRSNAYKFSFYIMTLSRVYLGSGNYEDRYYCRCSRRAEHDHPDPYIPNVLDSSSAYKYTMVLNQEQEWYGDDIFALTDGVNPDPE